MKGRQIELIAHYRGLIKRGDLKPGDKLPSIREMALVHDCAVETMARAVRRMSELGMVTTRVAGSAGGVYVEGEGVEASVDPLVGVLREIRDELFRIRRVMQAREDGPILDSDDANLRDHNQETARRYGWEATDGSLP